MMSGTDKHNFKKVGQGGEYHHFFFKKKFLSTCFL